MPRPRHNRKIAWMPNCRYFKPAGIPLSALEEIEITVVEAEALRLADYEGLYQTQAAEKMQVSRQTFGRILESARKKIAQALVEGKAINIEGGEFTMDANNAIRCKKCNYPVDASTTQPNDNCPSCGTEINTKQDSGLDQQPKTTKPENNTAENQPTPQRGNFPGRGRCRGKGRNRF